MITAQSTGLGGLDYNTVKDLIITKMDPYKEFTTFLYEPLNLSQ